MQSAGPASPKPQHRPGTAGAAPRTTLTVGPAARRRSGAPGLGQGGRGRARRPLAPPASPPALRLVPPPRPQSLLTGPRPHVDPKVGPGGRSDPAGSLESDQI